MALSGVLILLALSGQALAQNPNCDFFQEVRPGQKFYVYSPGYPNNYRGEQQCRWTAQCPGGRCRLDCTEINLPQSQNCAQDRFLVSKTGDPQLSGAEYYCGLGSLTAQSTSDRMTVGLLAPANTRGGRFVCELTAVSSGGGGGGGGGTCQCGMRRSNRIVGGQETGVNEYPMMAMLYDNRINRPRCGATVLSDRYVVTAAHCVAVLALEQTAVVVGEHDISTGSDSSATQALRVARFIIHPQYDPNTMVNDISIAQTATPMTLSDRVSPVCLPYKLVGRDLAGQLLTALGWGTQFIGGPTSDVLRGVDLQVTSRAQCQQSVPNLSQGQFCTYTRGKDACQDDSGGPLLWTDPASGRLIIKGIVSKGVSCAELNQPGMNTDVAAYMPWIEANTPGATYCRV